MALATKPATPPQRVPKQLWKTPTSKAWWLWLIASIVVYGVTFAIFYTATKKNPDLGAADTPLINLGMVAIVLVLVNAAFSLRKRFMRGLPGKAQNWLWMHTWIGIVALLVSFLHENYDHILHDLPFDPIHCAADSHFGRVALYLLILVVLGGIAGRLLDAWQARTIAREASTNGVGIIQSLKVRILELEYAVERLSAGKSEQFKQYCLQAIDNGRALPVAVPAVTPPEQRDFQQAYETLTDRSRLVHSLQKQERACRIIRIWRTVHITLACLLLLVLAYHVGMELLTHVLTVFPAQVNACS